MNLSCTIRAHSELAPRLVHLWTSERLEVGDIIDLSEHSESLAGKVEVKAWLSRHYGGQDWQTGEVLVRYQYHVTELTGHPVRSVVVEA